MLLGVIIGCEIGFWVFVASGLFVRYALRHAAAGAVLLACAPLVDLVLLAAAVADIRGGGRATVLDGLAGVYLGVSVGFGRSMMRWADQRFAHRFAGAPLPPPEPRYGRVHAARERAAWARHLLAWAVGCALLLLAVVVVGDPGRTGALMHVVQLWTLVLVIDGIISLSYTIRPRREPEASGTGNASERP